MTALCLRLSDEEVRIAVGLRVGTTLCEPHLCHYCREKVDASGLHRLVCRGGGGRRRTTAARYTKRHHQDSAKQRENLCTERASRPFKSRRKAAKRCHNHPLVTWTMPGNGCDSVPHLRHVSSCSHIHSCSCYRIVGGFCKFTMSRIICVTYSTGFLFPSAFHLGFRSGSGGAT